MSALPRVVVLAAMLALAAPARAGDDLPAAKFARLALACVHREYPNKISHVLNGQADAQTPATLHPVFYGCFDWHSSVHGHWLLLRLLRVASSGEDPKAGAGEEEVLLPPPLREEISTALQQSFTAGGVAGEVAYFAGPNREPFERPYGMAWFLQLMAELREWQTPQSQAWLATLRPLEQTIVGRIKAWLPKLAYPIRLGTHNQSMFAFGLFLDWARTAGDTEMTGLVIRKSLEFHLADRDCPLDYEPSGEDFLSPCLMEADLMRRILRPDDFAHWLSRFLPAIPRDGTADWLTPGTVTDRSDGKLVHLDGVNLSRAWNLENIAAALPAGDPRRASLLAASARHAQTGLASVSAEHYAGSHWLASFASYLLTHRGAPAER